MAHIRTQVRDAVETALTGLATPLALHMEARRRLGTEDMPALVVGLTDSEPSDDLRSMGSPYTVETSQTLLVEMFADDASARVAAQTVDQMELEVEAALAADVTLGGILENIEPLGSTVEVNSDQTRVIYLRAVTYRLTWRAGFGTPDVPEG